ncbi:MAG: hypothetical protein ACYC61_01370 [Isosphaeraceae bacterium]
MDSHSSGSTSPHAIAERPAPAAEGRAGVVLVAGLGHPVAAGYVSFVGQGTRDEVVTIVDDPGRLAREWLPAAPEGPTGRDRANALIVFVGPRLTEARRRELAAVAELARRWSIGFVGIVGSFRVHLDDPAAEEAERFAQALFDKTAPSSRIVVFRPGHLLGPYSSTGRALRWLAPFWPLIPARLATCVLPTTELFEAIEAERLGAGGSTDEPAAGRRLRRDRRAFTLLGTNTPWRETLRRHRGGSPVQVVVSAVARVVSWLLVGRLLGIVMTALGRLSPTVRSLHVPVIRPRSFHELIALCHAGNIGRVRVVGYNNGVHHFGHRYPGRTIISTVRCRRTVPVRAGAARLKADCGATIHDAMACLAERGEELHVVPNYSYVSLGTAFFVPIHGSAVDYATVADTITRVVLYDPERDRIVSARREDRDFAENVYNLQSPAVVLRLYLRARPKSRYFVRRETLTDATAAELLAALRDVEAENVEIRQGHAASRTVTVARYYTDLDDSSGRALELPRDALGRLWDRLEENPVTSFLMHALSRHLAWHTELFFTPAEFETFWRTHAQVPLRKIQLRYIRRDGMPHSPFRDEDRVSADLFLFRVDKKRFDAYTTSTLPDVRYNPGKHSN